MIGTVDAFLAAVSEAGWPPDYAEMRHHRASCELSAGSVTVVRWAEPGMPHAVGVRAREITGLDSAHPVSFRVGPDNKMTGWLTCWLWDNAEPHLRADAVSQ